MHKVKIGDFKTSTYQKAVINEILETNIITEGPFVKKFEESIKKFIKVKNAIAVANGTVALQLVAEYIKGKIGKKNPVVCIPATTFPATLNAFLLSGYKPILCDISKADLCINIKNLTEAEKKSIDVMVPVSLLGYVPNMEKIMEEAEKYGWLVVEDYAEAFGSSYRDKKLGSIGHFNCSSFFVSHVLQGGELGVITTDDDTAAGIMRMMKNHGRDGDPMLFKHSYIGSNYKSNEFCAGLAYCQLIDADKIIEKRQKIANIYNKEINNPGLEPMPVGKNISFLGYPILAKTEKFKNEVCKLLRNNEYSIETRGIFPCLANQTAYSGMFNAEKYPNSVEIESRGFYIGVHQLIKEQDAKFIARLLSKGIKWKPEEPKQLENTKTTEVSSSGQVQSSSISTTSTSQ